jgi:oligoribonuclease NrnB/cAMP/cGMP phosphodiesterase (DHH superfamily)
MTVLTITHGDDVDGLTCGAFLKRLKNSEVFLANYDNLEFALGKVKQPVDTLYLCDLNIRDSLEPLLNRINEFAKIFIIDHHQMQQAFRDRLVAAGINVILCINDCAGMLVYDRFKVELGYEARRIASYAAISDMFENGPIASGILRHLDIKFAQHEAQILTHALSANQTITFKQRIIEALSEYCYPHRIEGVIEAAVHCLEKMTKIKEIIPEKTTVAGRLGYMEAINNYSTGGISNLIIDTLGVDVGVSYKENGDYINISLRGEKGLDLHLGEISQRLGKTLQGFGGGHKRASGVKIPRESFEEFLNSLKSIIN